MVLKLHVDQILTSWVRLWYMCKSGYFRKLCAATKILRLPDSIKSLIIKKYSYKSNLQDGVYDRFRGCVSYIEVVGLAPLRCIFNDKE